MKVLLAGYNVDSEVLEELRKNNPKRADVTPETLSAAYARISRDPRPINELRRIARDEVEKARHSNQSIIFKMGHHSIAEHAVFNFDLIGVSRLALEELEKFRLCSFTEKSQRYQRLEDNFVIPEEIKITKLEKDFIAAIESQNDFYQTLIGKGVEPEDARYVTSLATQGQVGLTINARNLELLFRRFASHPLREIQSIGLEMFKLVETVAPSIILFTKANDFDQKTYPELRKGLEGLRGQKRAKTTEEVILADYTKKADDILLAALLHSSSTLSFKACLNASEKMSKQEKTKLIETCFKYAEFYDRPLREFEYPALTYDLVVSAACFGQLKRHRMATITSQPYNPDLGVTIPASIEKAGVKKKFKDLVCNTEKAYNKIIKSNPLLAPYILTNAHRRRVLFKINLRELYHVSRLREDKHAQWDIQALSRKMTNLAQRVMPLSLLFIGGKDVYPDKYASHFDKKPKIMPLY